MKKLLTFCALAFSANAASAQYCVPVTTNPCVSGTFYIKQVVTTGGTINISNTNSSCGTTSPGYSIYSGTGNILNAPAGATGVKLQVVTNVSWSYRCYVWVDWNQDGEFNNIFYSPASPATDTGELMITSVNIHPVGGVALAIPPRAKNGLTRMRIRMYGILPSTNFPTPGADPCLAMNALYGEVEDYDLYCDNPCVKIPSVTFANTNSKGTDVTWTPRGNEKLIEYLVDQSPNNPGTGNILISPSITSMHLPDTFMKYLACNTKYYFHIRGVCDTDSHNQGTYYYGPWRLDSFTTDPCCDMPPLTISDVTSHTAMASWGPVTSVQKYEYMVRIDTIPPTKGTFTPNTSVFVPGLQCSREYYFFLRALCSPTPLSDWRLDSFLTQPCLGVDNKPILPPFRMNAYPNPVKDVLSLSMIRGMRLGEATISVMDVTGKVLSTYTMKEDHLEINMASMPSGMYMLRYADEQRTHLLKVNKE